WGTKVEVKNLNSFRSVEKAIEYELERQRDLIEAGEKVAQETRGWDDAKGQTFSQRKKESSHDYRYFPEPDLPKLKISEVAEWQNLKETLPELPWQKRERLRAFGLQAQDVEQYLSDLELGKYFEIVSGELKDPALIKIASNFIANDIAGNKRKDPNWSLPTPSHLIEVVRQFSAGKL